MIKRKHGFSRIDLYFALAIVSLIAAICMAGEHSNGVIMGRSVAIEQR